MKNTKHSKINLNTLKYKAKTLCQASNLEALQPYEHNVTLIFIPLNVLH